MHGHYAAWRSGSKIGRYNATNADLLRSLQQWLLIHHNKHEGDENVYALEESFDLHWRL